MTRPPAERAAVAVVWGIGLVFLLVFGRVAQLQLAPPRDLRPFLTDRARPVSVTASRGSIVDRRGRVLAGSRTGSRLFLDPTRFPVPSQNACERLGTASGYTIEEILSRLEPAQAENRRRRASGASPRRYVPVGGILPPGRASAVADLRIPGAHLERRPVRDSLAIPSLAPLVGKVGCENHGLLGIEHALDAELAPTAGSARVVRDADGDPLWIEGGALVSSHRGADVTLSVDAVIQRFAETNLARGLEDADAAAGRMVVIDPRTGEILAMLDLYRQTDAVPFDPENVPDPDATWPRYDVIPPDPKRDTEPALARLRCVEDAYEPGSTFKPIIWSAVLERGKASLDETINTHGGRWRTPYGRPVADVVARDHQTVFEVLVNSSNIGMTQLADRLTDAQLQDAIRKFGFGAPTGLPLPGEAAGLVTPPSRWNAYTRTSVSFGYEVAVTPVQMIRAFSAYARPAELAGTLPRLSLLHHPAPEARLLHRVIPAAVAHAARDAMREVARIMIERSHAAGRLDEGIPSYDLFGKSGTALIPRPDGKGYFQSQYVSSFIAAAPADDPAIAVLVVIDDPGPARIAERSHYGSAIAGPVVARMIQDTLEYLGVAPEPPASDLNQEN